MAQGVRDEGAYVLAGVAIVAALLPLPVAGFLSYRDAVAFGVTLREGGFTLDSPAHVKVVLDRRLSTEEMLG
jgi:hypothetical protein